MTLVKKLPSDRGEVTLVEMGMMPVVEARSPRL
jgi:hypothetical protein